MKQFVRAIVLKGDALLVMERVKNGREYCSLVGGAIDPGETAEQALYRELAEETGVKVKNHQLLITQTGGGFGKQYIYFCDYVSGEPVLHPDSVEAKIRTPQHNYYQPAWLPLSELAEANLLPAELKARLLDMLPNNLPREPLELTIK